MLCCIFENIVKLLITDLDVTVVVILRSCFTTSFFFSSNILRNHTNSIFSFIRWSLFHHIHELSLVPLSLLPLGLTRSPFLFEVSLFFPLNLSLVNGKLSLIMSNYVLTFGITFIAFCIIFFPIIVILIQLTTSIFNSINFDLPIFNSISMTYLIFILLYDHIIKPLCFLITCAI